MKTKLFFILLLFPLFGMSQGLPNQILTCKNTLGDTAWVYPPQLIQRLDLWQEWELYIKDCNTKMADTIQMEGVIHCKWKLENGKYVVVPKDTIWKDYKKYMKQYKYEYEGGYLSASGTSWTYYGTGIIDRESDNDNNLPVFKDFKKHIYWIKKRKATWDDFWGRWLVEKSIIKLN